MKIQYPDAEDEQRGEVLSRWHIASPGRSRVTANYNDYGHEMREPRRQQGLGWPVTDVTWMSPSPKTTSDVEQAPPRNPLPEQEQSYNPAYQCH